MQYPEQCRFSSRLQNHVTSLLYDKHNSCKTVKCVLLNFYMVLVCHMNVFNIYKQC